MLTSLSPDHNPCATESRDPQTDELKGLVFVQRKDGRGTAVLGGFVDLGESRRMQSPLYHAASEAQSQDGHVRAQGRLWSRRWPGRLRRRREAGRLRTCGCWG